VKKKVGHFARQLELAKELLHQLDIIQDSRGLSAAKTGLGNNLKKHCLTLTYLPRTIARSRSGISWIKDRRQHGTIPS
jgi:hypothetical protein